MAAVPAYRAIPGTPFLVDAFRHRPVQLDKVYFLTHAHSGERCSVGAGCYRKQRSRHHCPCAPSSSPLPALAPMQTTTAA